MARVFSFASLSLIFFTLYLPLLSNAISTCNETCRTTDDCDGLLICINGKYCYDDPNLGTHICASPPLAPVPSFNGLSTCDGPCRTSDNCDGQLICINHRCTYASYSNTHICPSPRLAPAPRLNVLSTCNGPCRTADNCYGQLICINYRCTDAPYSNIHICASPRLAPAPRLNALSTCNGPCRTADNCDDQLICISGKCKDDPGLGTHLCASPQHVPAPSISPPKEIIPVPNMGSAPFYNSSMHRRKMRLGMVIGVITGICVLIVGFIWFIVWRWKRRRYEDDNHVSARAPNELEIETGPRMFSYRELATATSNFAEKERLGEGGFGAVYKGFLKNLNIFVAMKKISGQSKQGIKEYAAEIKIISRLRHKNTVKLIGWCHVKELMLVYEFMPNGSLDSHLFKGKSLLTWEVRYKIVKDIASALLYLHEEGDDCVLHRDIKSSNIMLDSDFNAKLGDFGLARLVDHAKGSQTTGFAGTMGYMAPECFTATSKASKKSDVFGFGVVALEIACGRRSIERKYEEDQVSLVPWVWEAYGNRRHLDTTDEILCMNFDTKEMECLLIVGLWCAHPDRSLRPCIRQVIQVLNFEVSLPNLPPKMPIPKYDVPTASLVTSNHESSLVTYSCEPSLSLTIPR